MATIQIPDTDVTDSGNQPGQGPLRAGGQAMVLSDGTLDLPSEPNAAVKRQTPALQMARDLDAGPERVRAQTTTYLPKAPGETVANYNDRLQRSAFFAAFGQTVRGMTGLIFRRDPVLGEDVPEVIRGTDAAAGHWENIDLAGTHGDVFCRQLAQDAIAAGHVAILVEYPRTNGVQTAAAEMAGAVRPYWVMLRKDDIVSWRTEVIDGNEYLTQLVVRERTMVPVGNFREAEQTRYRVFYRENGVVGYRLFQIGEDKRSLLLVDEGTYPTQDEIPVAEIGTSGTRGLFDSDPPLLDLAYLNVAHYQQASDYAYLRYKTLPVLVTIGMGAGPIDPATGLPLEKEVVLGPNSGLDLPAGGDAKYIAADAGSLAEHRMALAELKGEMATLGLQQLAPEKRAAETATAKRIDKAASDSALAVDARALQDGIERALYFHARYLRLEDGGSVEINRDFDALAMDAQTIAAYSTLVQNGQLTLDTMWQMLMEGNALPADFDVDAEAAKLAAEDEIRSAQAAEEARRQLELAQARGQMPPQQQMHGNQGQQGGGNEEIDTETRQAA